MCGAHGDLHELTHSVPTRRSSDLSSVISAMRGIAAVRSREANARLAGIREYADTIGGAIAQALALYTDDGAGPAAGESGSGRLLILALCAEQGFVGAFNRSEEHTSELQSLMRISYAVFCLKKKTTITQYHIQTIID